MKKNKKILIIVAAVIVGLAVVKNPLIKMTITTVGSNVVGAPLKIKKFSLGLLTQKVHIKGMALYNPKGFPKEKMADIPEIRVDYDVPAFLSGKLHARLVIFDMKEMVVIKDKDGNLNVDALKVVQAQEPKEEEEKPKEKTKAMAMQIDELRLNVERVVLKDFSKGTDKPEILVYEVALKDKVFKNIENPAKLATLIMVNAMGPTAIQGAKVYAAASVLGVAFLPAGVVGMLVGKDSSTVEYDRKAATVYDAALAVLKEIGEVTSEDPSKGALKAKVDSVDIAVSLEEMQGKKTKSVISARKMLIPKAEIAAGIQYRIEQKL